MSSGESVRVTAEAESSVYARLVAAVTPVVPVCEPAIYGGDAEAYCTYNATEMPEGFGDDAPHALRYLLQLHYFCPLAGNPLPTVRQLRQAVFDAGFTYPTMEDASDLDGRHYVLEFEEVGGVNG